MDEHQTNGHHAEDPAADMGVQNGVSGGNDAAEPQLTMLPFAFAKRFGVVLTGTPHSRLLICQSQPNLATLAEAQKIKI